MSGFIKLGLINSEPSPILSNPSPVSWVRTSAEDPFSLRKSWWKHLYTWWKSCFWAVSPASVAQFHQTIRFAVPPLKASDCESGFAKESISVDSSSRLQWAKVFSHWWEFTANNLCLLSSISDLKQTELHVQNKVTRNSRIINDFWSCHSVNTQNLFCYHL